MVPPFGEKPGNNNNNNNKNTNTNNNGTRSCITDVTSICSTNFSLNNQSVLDRPPIGICHDDSTTQRVETELRALSYLLVVWLVCWLCVTLSLPGLLFLGLGGVTARALTRRSVRMVSERVSSVGLLEFLGFTSLVDTLTDTTLHDYLTSHDDSLDWPFWLLLYLVPGLTDRQRASLLHRLPEHRRALLFAPGGLGRLLAVPDAIGGIQLLPPTESGGGSQILPRSTTQPSGSVSNVVVDTALFLFNGFSYDNTFNDTSNNTNHRLTRPPSQQQLSHVVLLEGDNNTRTLPNDLVWDERGRDDSDSDGESTAFYSVADEEAEDEGDVLYRALDTALRTYRALLTDTVSHSVLRMITPARLRTGWRTTGLLAGATAVDSSLRLYYHTSWSAIASSSLRRLTGRSRTTTSDTHNTDTTTSTNNTNLTGRILLGSTLFAGATTGLLYCVRARVRSNLLEARALRELESSSSEEHDDHKS